MWVRVVRFKSLATPFDYQDIKEGVQPVSSGSGAPVNPVSSPSATPACLTPPLLSSSNALVDFSISSCPLPQLTSLALLQRHHSRRPTSEDSTAAATNSIRALITTHAATLRSLCVYGDLLLHLDVSAFEQLTELSIINPRTLPDLTAIFERCTAIRAFALCDKARYDGHEDVSYEHWSNDAFIDVLRAHPRAFPHLAAFKLMGAWFWADQVDAIAAFLRDKAGLRRLDLVNDKWTRWDGDGVVDDWGPVLEILSGFPRLEVVGLDMRGALLTRDDMRCLARCIPRGVTALAVTVFAESSKARAEDWRRLVSFGFGFGFDDRSRSTCRLTLM